MRRFLLIFMIALLPLRGWASESMVVSMAVQQLAVAEKQAEGDVARPAECPMWGQATNPSSADISSQDISPLCKGCTTCQLCMALVTGYAPTFGLSAQLPHAERVVGSVSFTSAERATGFKPPIS